VEYVRSERFCTALDLVLSILLERPPTAGLASPNFLEALRREAGVMFGELSSSESDCCSEELLMGVVGRPCSRDVLLPLSAAFVGRGTARSCEGFLTAFRAPDFGTLRLKLTVVMRVDLIVGRVFRSNLDCVRLELEAGVDLFRARVWREAICRECSAASCSARARAVPDWAPVTFEFAGADCAVEILRFLGDFWLSSCFALTEPIMSCNLRFVPAMIEDVRDRSSTGFFGLGPSTPRQDSVPHRHIWIFFWENGLKKSAY
jgi:hypothetical protein